MSRQGLLLLIVAVLVAAGTARLGFWQLDRAAQKLALQSAIDSRRQLSPLDARALARTAEEAERQLHRRVAVTGRWLPALTVYLDNRQMDGRVGFFVLTPLRLADGSAVLVQRGWQMRDFVERSQLRPPPTPTDEVAVEGRLARGPARLYEFDGAASGPIRQNLDIASFARETGVALRPLLIVQDTASTDDGLQRQWPRPAARLQTHYGYAFQWFALSALTVGLYVWFRILRPRRRAAAGP